MVGIIIGIVIVVVIVGVAAVLYKGRNRTVGNLAQDKTKDVKNAVEKAVDKTVTAAKNVVNDINKKTDQNK